MEENKDKDEEKDVLEMKDVALIAHMVESNMPPSIKIPGFNL